MDAAVQLGGLEAWMDGRGLGEGPLADVRRLGGGSQNLLVRLMRGERAFVLRRPPEGRGAKADAALLREARVLGALAGTGVPHPGLVAACDDPGVLGAAFLLMEAVEGFNAVDRLPALHASHAAVRWRMGLSIAEAAARIGVVDYERAGLGDLAKLDGFLERQVPRWSAQLEGYGKLAGWPGPAALAGLQDVGRWLEDRRPARFQPGLTHGDFHIANVMYRPTDGEIAAVVDWELAAVGAPLLDLGWLLATWPDPARDDEGPLHVEPWDGFPPPEALIKAYAGASALDLSDIGWWRVMACFKLAILLEGGFARACAGLAPKDVGERLHGRALNLAKRAQAWMSQ
jgi:aminoglycoside phosphotransferase (APT) family kinase protein